MSLEVTLAASVRVDAEQASREFACFDVELGEELGPVLVGAAQRGSRWLARSSRTWWVRHG
jgi:hypothetical protein